MPHTLGLNSSLRKRLRQIAGCTPNVDVSSCTDDLLLSRIIPMNSSWQRRIDPDSEDVDKAPESSMLTSSSDRRESGARRKRKRYWDPSLRLLNSLSAYSDARSRGGILGTLQSKVAVFRHRFWSVITGADIPLNAYALGAGLELPHPNGIVIHPDAKLGPDCRLFQQVTIGTGPKPGLPQLGARVWVGAGAKILGGVVIGDDAVVGANAVVITDVPEDCVAVGIPAVIKPRARRQWDQAESRRSSQLRPTERRDGHL